MLQGRPTSVQVCPTEVPKTKSPPPKRSTAGKSHANGSKCDSTFESLSYPSAYGKVPHVVAERGFHRWGFLRLSAGACGKCSNIYFFTKMVSNISKRGSQKEAKGSQKGANDQENHQKSCLGAFEVFFFFFFPLIFFVKIVKTVMAHL